MALICYNIRAYSTNSWLGKKTELKLLFTYQITILQTIQQAFLFSAQNQMFQFLRHVHTLNYWDKKTLHMQYKPALNSDSWYVQVRDHRPVLGLSPARIREISKPLLNAWLNISRVWKVDINGSHERMTMGIKMNIPMPASYKRASDRTDFHKRNFLTNGFHATAIWWCMHKRVRYEKAKRY